MLVGDLPDDCLGAGDGSGSDAAMIDDLSAAVVEANWDNAVAKAQSYSSLLFVIGVVAVSKVVLDKLCGGAGEDSGVPCASCVNCAQHIMGLLCLIYCIKFLNA